MLVLNTLLRVFSHLMESETLRSVKMMCSSSASMVLGKSSMSSFLFMLLNALLMSLLMIVLSMISLEVKTCLVVDLFGL